MRLPLPTSKFSPARLISRISVRARIIIIAMIPVIGFLANGVEYMVAQSEVEDAFHSAHQAAQVAEASREFKLVAGGHADERQGICRPPLVRSGGRLR